MPTGLGGEKLWLCPTLEGENLDLSGNGNHGTYYGGMGTVADRYKGSRAFDFDSSSNQYVSVSTLDMRNLTKFSWSAWIRNTRVTETNTIFFSSSSSGGSEYLYDNFIFYRNVSTGRARVAVDNNSDGKGDGGVFPNGVWNHAAVVFDGNGSTNSERLRYFLNGEEVSMTYNYTVPSVTPNRATTLVVIGGYAYNLNANGAMDGQQDDIRVFERTLSLSEIKHLSSYRGVLGSPYYKPPTVKSRVTRLLSDRDTTEPPTETATSGLIRLKSPRQTNEVNWDDPLNKGLVAWYPFKQKGGNVLRNIVSGQGGTLTNMSPADDWVTAPQTKSHGLAFDGTDDVVVDESVSLKSGEGSIEACFKIGDVPASGDYVAIVGSYGSSDSNAQIYVGLHGVGGGVCRIAVVIRTNDSVTRLVAYGVSDPNNNLISGGEHHVVLRSNDSSTIQQVYVDGRLHELAFDTLNNPNFAWWDNLEYPNRFCVGAKRFDASVSAPFDGVVSGVRVYDRSLSEPEIHDLYVASRTGYADQFKRRYFPVSLPTEEPPTETATSGLIRLKSPKQTQPSYKAGYAKSASESASPELWDGLVGAWVSNLGDTGRTLKDVTGRAEDGYDTNNFLTRVMTKSGPATYMNKDGDRSFYSLGSVDVGITTQATWVYDAEIISYSSNGTMWDWDSSGTYDTWAQLVDSGSKVRWGLTTDSGRVFLDTTSAAGTGDKILVFRWDGSEMTIWANGVKAATGSHSGLFADSTGNHRIGGASGNEGAHANFRSLLVYNRAISDNEIQSLHADPLAPFRQRRYAPFSLTTEEPPTTFNHWYAVPGRINRIVGSGVNF